MRTLKQTNKKWHVILEKHMTSSTMSIFINILKYVTDEFLLNYSYLSIFYSDTVYNGIHARYARRTDDNLKA